VKGNLNRSLVDLLRCRARETPGRRAYTFLADGEREAAALTYGELDCQSRAIASLLQRRHAAGERALLLYPPGLEFIAAFFGCLYAGLVAVPASPPRPDRRAGGLSRAQAIARDAGVGIVLGTGHIVNLVDQLAFEAPELERAHWLPTDGLPLGDAACWREPAIERDTLAFLQYTSGSTAEPKGVMVSHGNLLRTLAAIDQCEENDDETVSVCWLPSYHDMGLIDGLLEPIYGGYPAYLMAPAAFLQRPIRWLQAISRYRATNSGGPNFAYDLCVRKTTPEECQALDLRSWRFAYNGAEPIRWETLECFWKRFRDQGFRWNSFYPAYGLAEATLVVSGGGRADEPRAVLIRADRLAADRVEESAAADAVRVTSCGPAVPGTRIAIARPETGVLCESNEVGEIWVHGPTVAQGYWNRPEETLRTFNAHLANGGDGPFLRTGDLGFLDRNELVVTGRIKDVIIVRGRKHYPQDIERSVEACHAALLPGCVVAFTRTEDGDERLAVAAEVRRSQIRPSASFDDVFAAVRQAVAGKHGLSLHKIALLRPGGMPKTSSGKLQRHACRAGLHSGALRPVAQWRQETPAAAGRAVEEGSP